MTDLPVRLGRRPVLAEAATAQTVAAGLSALGVARVGERGEVFDPALHAAVAHHERPTAELVAPTVVRVHRPGSRLAGTLLRPRSGRRGRARIRTARPNPDPDDSERLLPDHEEDRDQPKERP